MSTKAPLSPRGDIAARLQRLLDTLTEYENSGVPVTVRELRPLEESLKKAKEEGAKHALLAKVQKKFDTLNAQCYKNPDTHTGDTEAADMAAVWSREGWAPINIPTARRMQTLTIAIFNFFTGFPLCYGIAIFLLLCPVTMPFMVLYLVSMFVFPPKHPLKRNEWFVRCKLFQYYRDYFPIRLVVPDSVRKAIDPKKNYLFCGHPHGVHSFSFLVNFGSEVTGLAEKLPGLQIHPQTLAATFYVPFWRQTTIAMGTGDASAKTLRKTLTAGPGKCALLVVGGAAESLQSSPKTFDLTLSKRRGFVKIALQTGADLVPVFSFGETDVYGNLADGRPKVQKALKWMQKRMGFALPLISGRGIFNYGFGPLPHRRPIVTVVGEPVVLPTIKEPTQEDINMYHEKYCEALMRLYDENVEVFAAVRRGELTLK